MDICVAGGTRSFQVRSQSGRQRGQSGCDQRHPAPYGPWSQETFSVNTHTRKHTQFKVGFDFSGAHFSFLILVAAGGVISYSVHTSTAPHKPVKWKKIKNELSHGGNDDTNLVAQCPQLTPALRGAWNENLYHYCLLRFVK